MTRLEAITTRINELTSSVKGTHKFLPEHVDQIIQALVHDENLATLFTAEVNEQLHDRARRMIASIFNFTPARAKKVRR